MRTALVWVVTQRVVVITDVSGQPVGPIFRVQESKSVCIWFLSITSASIGTNSFTLNMHAVRSSETSAYLMSARCRSPLFDEHPPWDPCNVEIGLA